MRKLTTLLLTLLLYVGLNATVPTSGDYTYQQDKQFRSIEQLTGQTFVPIEYIADRGGAIDLEAGQIKIYVGHDFVAFKGVENLQQFGVVAKRKMREGYELKLADRRGTDFAKMQILTDRKGHVHTLNYYSQKYGVYTFYLPKKTASQLKKERAYFTVKDKHTLKAYTDLVNQTIVPYMQILDVTDKTALNEKISMKKQFKIEFTEKKVKFSNAQKSISYDVKRVKMKKTVKGTELSSTMEIKLKQKPKKIILKLDNKNNIESIAVKNTRYFLL